MVNNVLIITAPGQGSQTPGFLSPWLELPGLAEQIGAWSELAGRDLIGYGTTASAEEITGTAVAQPLLVAAALAAAGLLPGEPDAVAGHSVGELAAGAIAGVLSAADAVRLTRVRGEAMADATAIEPTGMTAVLGGDEATVLAAIAEAGLTPANVNGAGQIVAGGTLSQLEAFAAHPPQGARLRPLRVAGAFHTKHMAPAVEALAKAAAGTVVKHPSITLLSNADGAVITSGQTWIERIIAQVAAPVRWDLCMATMSDIGVTAVIELPPAGTLAGLAKRGLPGVEVLALKTPDQLDAARDLIATHASATAGYATPPGGQPPEWRIVVSPGVGTFRSEYMPGAATVAVGATVPAGAVLGHVVARSGERLIAAPQAATLVEWLAEDGDPVSEGQPLVRLEPKEDQ
jgi:[acyl-carrier-protein] S-malonyltransferase